MKDCETCAANTNVIAAQRNLMLDLANKYKINLNALSGDTPEEEWAALEVELRIKLKLVGVQRRRNKDG